MLKQCSDCGVEKPVDEFHRRSPSKDGYQPRCKDFARALGRAWYSIPKNKLRQRANSRRHHLRHHFGLSPEQFDAMIESQEGRCAICRTDTPGGAGTWHVDHDHRCCPGRETCGRCLRGLLCYSCNHALGKYESLRAEIDAYLLVFRR